LVKISAVIITFNEERNIERCLTSLEGVADEIVVLDSFSTDSTKTICKKFGVRFFENDFVGHIEQKNYALSLASYQYILSLDADECLSAPLKDSILQVKLNWRFDGYKMNRLNNYCGQWIRHGAWYPDRKIRLFDRKQAKWGGINPHDRIILEKDSKIGKLKGNLFHFTMQTVKEHTEQIEKFSSIRARELFKANKKVGFYQLNVKPRIKFLIDYIFKLGVLDGKNGFIIARKSAYAYRLRYQKLQELYSTQQSS
jgi:glycosyltransferase involved in cell wall biosynthesis